MESEHLTITSKSGKDDYCSLTTDELKEGFVELIRLTRRSVKDSEVLQCFKDAINIA